MKSQDKDVASSEFTSPEEGIRHETGQGIFFDGQQDHRVHEYLPVEMGHETTCRDDPGADSWEHFLMGKPVLNPRTSESRLKGYISTLYLVQRNQDSEEHYSQPTHQKTSRDIPPHDIPPLTYSSHISHYKKQNVLCNHTEASSSPHEHPSLVKRLQQQCKNLATYYGFSWPIGHPQDSQPFNLKDYLDRVSCDPTKKKFYLALAYHDYNDPVSSIRSTWLNLKKTKYWILPQGAFLSQDVVKQDLSVYLYQPAFSPYVRVHPNSFGLLRPEKKKTQKSSRRRSIQIIIFRCGSLKLIAGIAGRGQHSSTIAFFVAIRIAHHFFHRLQHSLQCAPSSAHQVPYDVSLEIDPLLLIDSLMGPSPHNEATYTAIEHQTNQPTISRLKPFSILSHQNVTSPFRSRVMVYGFVVSELIQTSWLHPPHAALYKSKSFSIPSVSWHSLHPTSHPGSIPPFLSNPYESFPPRPKIPDLHESTSLFRPASFHHLTRQMNEFSIHPSGCSSFGQKKSLSSLKSYNPSQKTISFHSTYTPQLLPTGTCLDLNQRTRRASFKQPCWMNETPYASIYSNAVGIPQLSSFHPSVIEEDNQNFSLPLGQPTIPSETFSLERLEALLIGIVHLVQKDLKRYMASKCTLSGASVTLSLIYEKLDGLISLAQLGDIRVILAQEIWPENPSPFPCALRRFRAIELTRNHTPNNPKEIKRFLLRDGRCQDLSQHSSDHLSNKQPHQKNTYPRGHKGKQMSFSQIHQDNSCRKFQNGTVTISVMFYAPINRRLNKKNLLLLKDIHGSKHLFEWLKKFLVFPLGHEDKVVELDLTRSLGFTRLSSFGLSCVPDVTDVEFSQHEMNFLIMGSATIWELFDTPQSVLDFITCQLTEKKKTFQESAQALWEEILSFSAMSGHVLLEDACVAVIPLGEYTATSRLDQKSD